VGRRRLESGIDRDVRRLWVAAAEQRNVLRFIFLDPSVRAAQYDWESVARLVVGAFRVDAARAGATAEVEPLVEELCRLSPEFEVMWRDKDGRSFGEEVKHIRHQFSARWPLNFRHSLSMAGRI
jgi:hypothetical protein